MRLFRVLPVAFVATVTAVGIGVGGVAPQISAAPRSQRVAQEVTPFAVKDLVPHAVAVTAPSPVAVPRAATPRRAPARKTLVRTPRVRRAAVPTVKPVVRSIARVAPKPQQAPKPTAAPAKTVVTTSTSGDSYPWKTATANDPDTWGFTERQCVSYVAWRLSRVGRAISNAGNVWGSALNWDDVARAKGLTLSSTPRVGSVAQWNAHESSAYYGSGSATPNGTFGAGGYGHVAWVTKVYADGSVQVSQYNGLSDRNYSSMHLKAPRYLYL